MSSDAAVYLYLYEVYNNKEGERAVFFYQRRSPVRFWV